MEMWVGFPGDRRVDVTFEGFRIQTDQPEPATGKATAPFVRPSRTSSVRRPRARPSTVI